MTRRGVMLLVGALALLTTLLAIFGGAAVSVGRAGSPGAEVTLTAKALPSTVSQGEIVTYELTASTTATSNLSHFTINAPIGGSTSPFPLVYIDSSAPDLCTAPADPPPAVISCDFGAFRAGDDPIVLFLSFRVPASQPNGTVGFQAEATYSGGSNNTNSGRTNKVQSDVLNTTIGTGANLSSGYVISDLGDSLSTVDSLTAPNGLQTGDQQQSARADVASDVLTTLFGVEGKVEDKTHAAGDTSGCGSPLLAPCWGQSENVTFLDSEGNDVELGEVSTLYIRTDKTEILKGVSEKSIKWFHSVNNGVPSLLPSCGTGDVPVTGCVKSVAKLGDGDLVTKILAFHHGQYRP
jgi:hypothetical protein